MSGPHTLLDSLGLGGGKKTFFDPAGIFGTRKGASTTAQQLAGIQLQTSVYGCVIPIIYGTTRLAGNLIYYTDFAATPNTTTQQTGKGGGTSTSNTAYIYAAFAMVALCEGPISSINRVWKDKAAGSLSGFGFSFTATGTRPQSPWATLTSKHPTQAVPYAGIAYVASASLPLNTDATLANFSFEILGFSASVQDPNALAAYDARPEAVVQDFLTNQYYGAYWNAAQIDSTNMTVGNASYATYCKACGFVISPAFDTQKACSSHLGDVLMATNSDLVWHSASAGMVLRVVPYGDQPISANGATYVPNTTPLYSLTYDDLITPSGNNPIQISRDSTQDVFNCVPIEYMDRLLNYNTNVIQMPDPVDVLLNGLKVDSTQTLHMITRAAHASALSLILGQRQVYIRCSYTFNVTLKYMLVEPMDLVNLTDSIIGFSSKTVRIISIDIPGEGSEEQGITIGAEEWPFGVASAALYTTQTPAGTIPNVNIDPGACSTPLIFASPALFSQSAGEICILAGGGVNWGMADVYASTTTSNYAKLGSINAPCRYGTISANLPAWAGGVTQDNTNTLSVTLIGGGTLPTGTIDNAAAAAGANLIWVDGEMISFQTCTPVTATSYNLTGLYRGLYGTSSALHLSGANWGRCDAAMLRVTLAPSQIGVLGYYKILSFNLWGGGGRSLSGETQYTYVPAAQSLPSAYNVTINITTSRPA